MAILKGCKMKDAVSLTELFTVSQQRFSGDYFFKGESHPFYEAVCVLKGRVGITAGKKVYVLSAGQMTIHRPGEFHAIWEDGSSRPEAVIFSFSASLFPKLKASVYELSAELVKELKALYSEAQRVFIIEPFPDEVLKTLSESEGKVSIRDGIYVNSTRIGMEKAAFRFKNRLEIFLSEALETVADGEAEHGKGSENYARILSVMEDNLDKNLSATELAALCKMSVPTLEKTVFRFLHSGAMAYYNVLRMERALTLLSEGKSVKETSLILGYSNQNYFSACFKKRYGIPPSEVKKAGQY